MLNFPSNLETAAGARAGSGLGAFRPGAAGTAKPNCTGAVALPRPRPCAVSAADVFGHGRAAAFQGPAAGQGQPSELQSTSEKYAHTTRIAAASGGALGPHSARDPV
jgi:hypothetical protein